MKKEDEKKKSPVKFLLTAGYVVSLFLMFTSGISALFRLIWPGNYSGQRSSFMIAVCFGAAALIFRKTIDHINR